MWQSGGGRWDFLRSSAALSDMGAGRARFARRVLQREIMDDHEPEQEVVDKVYAFLRMTNRRFGGTAATLGRLEWFASGWRSGERIDVLDIAAGAADVARALVSWGRRRGFDLRVTAVDLSASALDYARRSGPPDERLRFVRADVLSECFRDRSFDYVISSLFFHHLSDEQIVDVLTASDRLARRGLIVNDLVRSPKAWLLTWLVTWPFHPILHHDGPLSVRRALTPEELLALARRAGIGWLTPSRHFGQRMTAAGERGVG